MPCYQIRTISVEMSASNFDLLRKAFEALGLTITQADAKANVLRARTKSYEEVSFVNGRLRYADTLSDGYANVVKRAYARETVKYASRKLGWNVKEMSERKLVAQRRF